MNGNAELAEYVKAHSRNEITRGKSGASVCELDGQRIAKYVRRDRLNDASAWAAYEREAMFYAYASKLGLPFVPQIEMNQVRADEILLIMKKYRPLSREEINNELLEKILLCLAKIHRLDVPAFLDQKKAEPVFWDEKSCAEYLCGWKAVLAEHGDLFDDAQLHAIAQHANEINRKYASQNIRFVHGDFHFENILMDEDGNVVICDWQNCGTGDVSGDISFFISRLLSDGYSVDSGEIIQTYCACAAGLGETVCPKDVEIQIRLANLNTSFMFWHQYLHNSTEARVRSIYGKMIGDYHFLREQMK